MENSTFDLFKSKVQQKTFFLINKIVFSEKKFAK